MKPKTKAQLATCRHVASRLALGARGGDERTSQLSPPFRYFSSCDGLNTLMMVKSQINIHSETEALCGLVRDVTPPPTVLAYYGLFLY